MIITMKRILFVILFATIAFSTKAQFVLTPNGFATDDEKGYYVAEISGKSQADLFNALEIWVGGHFVSPADVISKSSAGNQITINGVVEDVTKMPGRMIKMPVDMNFTWQILIKDGKLRFNAPIINSLIATGNTVQTLHIVRPSAVQDGIFKKDGKVIYENTKADIEKFFNDAVADIIASMTENDGDW